MNKSLFYRKQKAVSRIHLVWVLVSLVLIESISVIQIFAEMNTENSQGNALLSTVNGTWEVVNPGAPGVNGNVVALTYDSFGNLYVGGDFTAAGNVPVSRIAKWDGANWSALGEGMNWSVSSLLCDTKGNLYAAGGFTTAGGIEVNGIAKWDGTKWSSLGKGISEGGLSDMVFDTVGNLYVGGTFSSIGNIVASGVAKWDGTTWSALGDGIDGSVHALAFDSLGNLYVGGSFTHAGSKTSKNIAKWDGTEWSPLGSGITGTVYALACDVSDNLYAGGSFGTAGGVSVLNIAQWEGSQWSPLGGNNLTGDIIFVLAFDSADNLYANGGVDGSDRGVMRWNGLEWSSLAGSMLKDNTPTPWVTGLVFDSLGNLYAGGYFDAAGDAVSPNLAYFRFSNTATISVFASPINGGTVSKNPKQASYTSGTQVTLQATPADGWVFQGWLDGGTTISREASFVYTVVPIDKIFTAKFKTAPPQPEQYSLAIMTDPTTVGIVSKVPNQTAYAVGSLVSLSAVETDGWKFVGWFDGATTVSLDVSFQYTVKKDTVLIAKFKAKKILPPPTVNVANNTYMVLVSWTPATSATAYQIRRVPVNSNLPETENIWTVGLVTQFADDTADPGVSYSYQVTGIDGQGQPGTPSKPVTVAFPSEIFTPATYKVVSKGYSMERNLPTTGSLTFTPAVAGSTAGTIKITRLTKVPVNLIENPTKGIYYLTNQSQVPELKVVGSVKTLAFDVPVHSLEVTGAVNMLQAKTGATYIKVGEMASAKLSTTRPMESGQYARTFITTNGSTPMTIQATGVVVEELGSATGSGQPVKLLNVASKFYKNEVGLKKTSLGAVGSLPRVVADVAGVAAPQSEATPSSIKGSILKSVIVSGGPLVADEMIGLIDKVSVSGGNIRCGLIRSNKDMVLLQATAQRINGVLVGGAVGLQKRPGEMLVQAQPNSKGLAIGKIVGQTGVSGIFQAGYNEIGEPNYQGAIKWIQTKTGKIEGVAHVSPASEEKIVFKPMKPDAAQFEIRTMP